MPFLRRITITSGWEAPVFYWIERHLQSRMLDTFMEFITLKWNWIIPGAAALALLVVFRGKRAAWLLAVAVVMVGLNDWICGSVIKPLVARPRPCQIIEFTRIAYSCSGSFSFPSNHASNSFAIATLFALWSRNSALLMYALALLVSFSRVYLGVHYPTDVLGGALCGIVMGYLGFRFYRDILIPRVDSPGTPACQAPSEKFSSSS